MSNYFVELTFNTLRHFMLYRTTVNGKLNKSLKCRSF